MRNAFGAVQSLLVLGGSSDIGAAIAERLVPAGCRTVVLAGRRPEAMAPVADRLRALGAAVEVTAWDAADVGGHVDAVKAAWEAAGGDVDCVVLAAGVLGEQDHLSGDPAAAAEVVTTNYTGPVSTHVLVRSFADRAADMLLGCHIGQSSRDQPRRERFSVRKGR